MNGFQVWRLAENDRAEPTCIPGAEVRQKTKQGERDGCTDNRKANGYNSIRRRQRRPCSLFLFNIKSTFLLFLSKPTFSTLEAKNARLNEPYPYFSVQVAFKNTT